MNAFTLLLQDATRVRRIDGVTAFGGRDGSGAFALWAGHERLLTELDFGLARYRVGAAGWRYLALPGALAYFHDNTLTLCTRRYLESDDHATVSAALREQLRTEEENLQKIKTSLHQMEDAVLKRLFEMNQRVGPA